MTPPTGLPAEAEPDREGPDPAAIDSDLDRALDLEGASRQRFLESLPAERRHRVSTLLVAAEGEGMLDRGLGEVAGRLLELAGADGETRLAGRTIGGWRVLGRLGSGGMGVVYRVERSGEDFVQRAALKVIRWELADATLVRRFLAERRILAQLGHPHIASLIDGGVTEEGLPYLVLELVEGEPIDRYCERRSLGREERLRLLTTVCRAVDFAHRQLVVHRDLKPSNILVRADGVPKLVDFGVAKLLDGAPSEVTRHAPLTPRYAAPEQLRGEPISVAADVFSLGRVLEELLIGPAPAEGESELSSLAGSARRSGPGLPRGDLANIVGRALHPEPEERYRGAGALALDLERYLDARPVEATPPTLRYRLAKILRRHRAASLAVAVAILTAVLGISGIVWKSREARAERDLARQQAARAEEVTQFLADLFSSSAPRLGGEPRVRDLLDQGAERIRDELDDVREARAELLVTLGEAYKWLLEFERAESLFSEAVELEARLAPGSERHAVALGALGGLYLYRGEPAAAEVHIRRALEMLERTGIETPGLRASLLNSLGMARHGQGDSENAARHLHRAVELATPDHGDVTAMARGNLGLALDRLGRHGEAEAEHRAALGLYRLRSPDNDTIANILNNLSNNLAAQGRLDEALAAIEESVALRRRSTSPGR
ncbi:MAG: serine/threonine-protein kinase, partial [Holophagales bacterium]|nr:serine/threonine-protein kinase [Holophagales bacterium]